MNEVAAKAGVSASTVCRALRSDPQIPSATRERVRAVAEALGYRPDPLLSAFALRRRGKVAGSEVTTIAYVTNFATAFGWRSNPFYHRCYNGAEARAMQLGYKLEHFWLKEPGMTGKRLSRILYNRGITAICVAPTPQVRGHLSLDWGNFSSVTIGYSLLRPALHRATPHHFHGVLMAVRELRRLGYKRIGLCLFAGTSKRVDDLWLAAALVYREYHRDTKLPVFLFKDETLPELAEWCRKERLEVLIGGEPAVLSQLHRSGVKVPGELDYATVNWIPEAPEIAGIDQRSDVIGATAIDLVIGQQQRGERGLPAMPLITMVEGRWMPGASLSRLQR